jgi:GAF domain
MRIALAVLCAIAVAGSTFFLVHTEQSMAAERTALRQFDRQAREAIDALAELRSAQQAYVAAGQSADFWMSKVDSTIQAIGNSLAALHHAAAAGAGSTAALAEGAMALTDFRALDQRIRGYLTDGGQLMAADIIFTEGGEATKRASQAVEKARVEELVASDRIEASRRRRQAAAAGGAAALVLLAVVGLALWPAPVARPLEMAGTGREAPADTPMPVVLDARADELLLRRNDQSDIKPPEPVPPARPTETVRSASALKAAAELCIDIGRARDLQEVSSLMGRTAELLDASGLVLWAASASGDELRPVAAHGYPPQTLARLPPVARSADNAAAAAYRTGAFQIVLSRPGSPAKGAVVAPVLAAEGCIGVLAAEVRDGAEASETTHALAAIVAAQLSGVVAATSSYDERASGGAAV